MEKVASFIIIVGTLLWLFSILALGGRWQWQDVISSCVDNWHFHGTFLGRIARHRQRRREGLVVSRQLSVVRKKIFLPITDNR